MHHHPRLGPFTLPSHQRSLPAQRGHTRTLRNTISLDSANLDRISPLIYLDGAGVQRGCGTCWAPKISPVRIWTNPSSCHRTLMNCALATYLARIIKRPYGVSQHSVEAPRHASLLLCPSTLPTTTHLLLLAVPSPFISSARSDQCEATTQFVWL